MSNGIWSFIRVNRIDQIAVPGAGQCLLLVAVEKDGRTFHSFSFSRSV